MKKRMSALRRIGAMALAAVMSLALACPAIAADDGKLTIRNAVQGGEYKVYSVMTATVAGGPDDAAYTYKLNDNPAMQKIMDDLVSDRKFGLADGAYGDDGKTDGLIAGFEIHNGTVSFRVEAKDGYAGDEATPEDLYEAWSGTPEATAFLYRFSDELRAAVEAAAKGGDAEAVLGKPFATRKADEHGVVTVEDMPYGYYMVISPMGQWAMTATVPGGDGNAVIREKNSVPTVSKKVFDTATGKFLADNDKAIGDELWYMAVIDTGTGVDSLTFRDTMDPGLTFDRLMSIQFYPRKAGAALEGDAKFDLEHAGKDVIREAYNDGNGAPTNYAGSNGYFIDMIDAGGRGELKSEGKTSNEMLSARLAETEKGTALAVSFKYAFLASRRDNQNDKQFVLPPVYPNDPKANADNGNGAMFNAYLGDMSTPADDGGWIVVQYAVKINEAVVDGAGTTNSARVEFGHDGGSGEVLCSGNCTEPGGCSYGGDCPTCEGECEGECRCIVDVGTGTGNGNKLCDDCETECNKDGKCPNCEGECGECRCIVDGETKEPTGDKLCSGDCTEEGGCAEFGDCDNCAGECEDECRCVVKGGLPGGSGEGGTGERLCQDCDTECNQDGECPNCEGECGECGCIVDQDGNPTGKRVCKDCGEECNKDGKCPNCTGDGTCEDCRCIVDENGDPTGEKLCDSCKDECNENLDCPTCDGDCGEKCGCVVKGGGGEGSGTSEVRTFVHELDVLSFQLGNDSLMLPGAEFVLYRAGGSSSFEDTGRFEIEADEDGIVTVPKNLLSEEEIDDPIYFIDRGNGEYVVMSAAQREAYLSETEDDDGILDGAATDTLVAPESGRITIKGLSSDLFRLVETKAPDGYSQAVEDIYVVIGKGSAAGAKIADGTNLVTESTYVQAGTAENGDGIFSRAGTRRIDDNTTAVPVAHASGRLQLPTTGGIGTTIFYVAGAALVLGAGALLVMKRRGEDEAD